MFNNLSGGRSNGAFRTRFAHLMAAILLLLSSGLLSAARAEVYRVVPGDVLSITVYGNQDLTGLFPISADGTIGYPILGNVTVTDATPTEIADRIGKSLSQHLANLSVAVTIKEYAPVFVVGDIQKAGKYEFRPGMIMLELFALAGGLREASSQTDTAGMQLVTARQEYEDMGLQLLSLDVRRTRFEAEYNDKTFDYNFDPAMGLTDATSAQRIIQSERNIFDLRRSAVDEQRRSLETQRQNFVEEIASLEKSSELRGEEYQLLQQDVDASRGLFERGVTSESALREKKREMLAMNRNTVEAGSFLARAKQNRDLIDQKLQDLQGERRNDAAKGLGDISLEILRLRKRMEFSLQKMAEISASAGRAATLEQSMKTVFSTVRLVDGQYKETVVEEHTPIRAGDIIRVKLMPIAETMTSSVN